MIGEARSFARHRATAHVIVVIILFVADDTTPMNPISVGAFRPRSIVDKLEKFLAPLPLDPGAYYSYRMGLRLGVVFRLFITVRYYYYFNVIENEKYSSVTSASRSRCPPASPPPPQHGMGQ